MSRTGDEARARVVAAARRLHERALQAGEPVLLDEVEMAHIAEKFRTHGAFRHGEKGG